MKLAVALAGASGAMVVALSFLAVLQELNLRNLKTRMSENFAEVKRKEEALIEVKKNIKQLKTTLVSVSTRMDELRRKKAVTEKTLWDLGQSLQSCNREKADVQKKKTDAAEAITKLKADHEAAKKKAEDDIKGLKQQILDRDKAILAVKDQIAEEARFAVLQEAVWNL